MAPTAPAAETAPLPSDGASVKGTILHKVATAEAPFNAQKVAEIRQAIAEGRFQINPERIADGLINNVRDMLARNGKAG